ncbi:MAG: hypothetical protein CMJ19_18220 [Phycisphaeraceae bacterium]|nr:hypothetical protein [Phycisphaeraceae bacterium]
MSTFRFNVHTCLTLLAASLMATFTVSAADLYMSPSGSGNKSGNNWDNALQYNDAKSLEDAYGKLKHGDTLNLAAGQYIGGTITLKNDGKSEKDIVTIKGQIKDGKMPTFVGEWGKHDANKGFTLFNVEAGSSWIGLQNIAARNVRGFFWTNSPGNITGIRIKNVEVRETRDGFIFTGGASASKPEIGTNDVRVEDAKVIHYSKRGFRIRDGVYNATFKNCVADAGGKEWATEPFHMGFSCQGGSGSSGVYDHDITFIDCIARNNYHDAGSGYWNADGFCAERNCYNITYVGCIAYDNTDGGWDDKSANPLLIGCVAIRNKRNLRFWSNDPGVVLYRTVSGYPYKRGGNSSSVCMWTGGIARIYKSTFFGDRPGWELSRYRAPAEVEAALRAFHHDSIVVLSDANQADKRIILENTKVMSTEESAKVLPDFAYGKSEKFEIGTALDGLGSGSNQGYHASWRSEDYMTIGRKLQPAIVKEGKLLDAKPINVFIDKNPTGWYFSGWRGADMKLLKGQGIDGSNCMGVLIKGTAKGDGATYRTKRAGCDINLEDRKDANWHLSLMVNTNGNKKLPNMAINIYSMDKSQKTRELPLADQFDASSSDWQPVSIPVKAFESGATFKTLAGFYIRCSGSLDRPFLIDDVKLTPGPSTAQAIVASAPPVSTSSISSVTNTKAQPKLADIPTGDDNSLKSITVYDNKRDSGWYHSGWSGGKMKDFSGKGPDGSNCIGITGTPGQGGVTFRTKREGTDHATPDSDQGQWHLQFVMSSTTNMKIKLLSLESGVGSKEVYTSKYKVGDAVNGWQKYSIPLKDSAPKAQRFSGIAIRVPKALSEPIMIDNMTLELLPN